MANHTRSYVANYTLASKCSITSLSKNFEKLIYLQIHDSLQNKFSIYLTGFQKNHGTQHASLKIVDTAHLSLEINNS